MQTKSFTPALHADAKEVPSGLDAHAITGLEYKSWAALVNEQSPPTGDMFEAGLVLPLVLPIESEKAMRFFARHFGGMYLPSPRPILNAECPLSRLAASFSEFADYAGAAASAAMVDSAITADVLERIENEGHKVVTAVTAAILKARGNHHKQFGRRQ